MRPIKYLLTLLIIPLFTLTVQGQSFTPQNNAVTNEFRTTFGHAWGDFDNDGFQDLFLCNGIGGNQLFKNNGDGSFTEIVNSNFTRASTTTYSASWGDFNNDGHLDLLIVNAGSTPRNILLENDKLGGFINNENTAITKPIGVLHSRSYSVSWVDINNDGWIDAVEVNQIRVPIIYSNKLPTETDPTKIFTTSTLPPIKTYLTGVWSDYNNNRFQDLFMTTDNAAEHNSFFQNNNGILTQLPDIAPVIHNVNHYSSSWGDFDNDGYMDLFITGKGANPNLLYRNINGTSFELVNQFNNPEDIGDSRGSCWGDFNNDGWIDLYVANAGGENFLYQNNGDGTFTKRLDAETLPLRIVGNSHSCSFVDYNNDGFIDLFVTDNSTTYRNSLFRNNGNTNKWISVKLIGSASDINPLAASNHSAIGAKIHTVANINGVRVKQIREVSGQSAYGAQSGFNMHFGLGNAAMLDSLIIEWPSGIVQIYSDEDLKLHFFTDYMNRHLEILEIQPPTTPLNLTATANSSTEITIEWNAPVPTMEQGKYFIKRSTSEAGVYVKIGETATSITTFQDAGLAPETQYFYKIVAINPSGEAESLFASATTDAVPVLAPTDLAATLILADQITLQWVDNSDNETGFVLERSTSGTPTQFINLPPNTTTFVDTGLDEETEYSYRIKAIMDTESSAFSNVIVVTTNPFVIPPTDFIATATSYSQISLSWGSDNLFDTEFVIERSLDALTGFVEIHTADATDREYSDNGLTPNTLYYYKIKAVGATHSSKYSEANTATLEYALAAPSGLMANALSPVEVHLSWTDNSNNETGFVLERNSIGLAKSFDLGPDVITFIDTDDLEEETEYTYRIKAVDGSESSSYSEEVVVVTPPYVIPPSDLIANAISSSQIDLSWIDNSENETGFVIERSLTSGSGYVVVHNAAANTTTYSDMGLEPNTTYFYRIKATDGTHDSKYSAEASAATLPFVIIAPADLAANVVSPMEIHLSWLDNSDNEGGFVIERSTAGQPTKSFDIGPNTVTFIDNDDLSEETVYTYRIKAINGMWSSEWSNEVNATTPPFILPPSNLTANAITHKQINLNWQDNSVNATGFIIERSLLPASGFSIIHTTPSYVLAYSDINLDPLTTYYYRVKAINATHESKYSGESNSTTLEFHPLTLTFPTKYEEPGTQIEVPITVKNFKDVLAFQFVVNWDPAVLTFMGINNLALIAIEANDPEPGKLIVLWDDATTLSQTLSDNTVLFNIRYQVVGASGTNTTLTIPTGGSLPLLFADKNSVEMDVVVNEGSIYSQSLVTLSGKITNSKGEPVKGVAVDMVVSGGGIESIISSDGTYEFQTKPGNTVEIELFKNDVKVNNGITTLDIALIRRHLLDITLLDDPYKLIAADVNKSGSVSIMDVPPIRRVVLGMESSFNGQLWRFVPKDYVFANPANPFPFDEKISIPFALDNNSLDFIGVKLGDVNYSWDHNVARKKSGSHLDVLLQDVELDEQEYITLPVRVRNFNNLSAYQFTLTWDAKKLEFVKTTNPLQAYFGEHRVKEGLLTVAWDDPKGKSLSIASDSEIISLTFKVLKAEDSEVKITSELTMSIAYDADLNEVEINPTHAKINASGENNNIPVFATKVYPNYPNPVGINGTTMHFDLAEASQVRIIIYNTIGKLVDVIEGNYPAGENKIKWIPKKDLNNGIYIYQIECDNQRFTNKLSLFK